MYRIYILIYWKWIKNEFEENFGNNNIYSKEIKNNKYLWHLTIKNNYSENKIMKNDKNILKSLKWKWEIKKIESKSRNNQCKSKNFKETEKYEWFKMKKKKYKLKSILVKFNSKDRSTVTRWGWKTRPTRPNTAAFGQLSSSVAAVGSRLWRHLLNFVSLT